MNQLLNISEQKATLTMSSREIASLINKNHSDLCRSIERLISKGVIKGYQPMAYTHPQNGQTYYEYHLEKRDCLIVVAQNCPEFTAAIVDRWQELENQQKPTALSRKELALMVLQAEEENERLQLENAQLKPKANFVDHYVEVGTSKSLREVAKILKMPERAMIERLIQDRLLYRQSGALLPYQTAHSRDLFTVKTGTAEHGHNYTQTRVTSKGIEYIASRYASELML
ncbi:phage antirepressor KilAC domain-containing protein [Pasteurella multocida]|uniref:Phage antirepressor KilAC domain-containing protein n=1 Tax=Pasteurella multocida TaxID=747 RepID=A0AAW8VB97_PASMD|nr:phage antirepressor KilAC domain-containing protein [Pasteurella multocida]MDH7438334.1 phage antirepressor KilAC domain-containing protein [Pasteurella multocida]MDH7441036.1 phage antirepressor KilAC domain-containing protein [Pasteurella multocida]MDT3453529.1 phage antirepressor KilAC domain-containing protein [Pasteurella multocida]MDY0516199.1 phage antirepressor KilAC domain-containing protein [Pasteurella multocida]MDY0532041.1 phage antirepressor KilAC domain-containing protein [Pa